MTFSWRYQCVGPRRAALLVMGVCLIAAAPVHAETIDRLLAGAHREAGIEPAAVCDDATFLRRLSLDLIGRVPSEAELDRFLGDPDRSQAIETLLASNEHRAFWSHLWTSLLLGRAQQQYVEREVLRAWVQDQMTDPLALDQFAFELISAEGVTSLDGPVNYVAASRRDPVMRLSRTFLSVQLDCAQCHDHPFDRWTNDDYESMQRFFSQTRFREVSGGYAVADEAGGDGADLPTFLTGRKPHTSAWRRELGMMVVTSKPFSRAMVNRVWHWLMGRGLVDPVDGLSRENPAATPELLEQLASDLRRDRFDQSALIRRICESKAYQRRSDPSQDSQTQERRQLFAVRNARPLLPRQWIASVATVLDRPMPEPDELAVQSANLLGVTRQAIPATDPFAWSTTTQTLIRQLSRPLPSRTRSIDSLFKAALARDPSAEERKMLQGRSSQERVYAVVHGNEFMLND